MEIEKKLPNSLELVRQQVLLMPADKALDAIIANSKAGELVKSFSAQDLYFLVHEIGPEDSLPILSLASTRQWQYFLDVDAWKDDQVNLTAMTRWMELLFAADPDRLVKWLATHETELFELWMYENLSVQFLTPDDDSADIGDGYFTFDGTFYVRVNEEIPADNEPVPDKTVFIQDMLRRLASMDLNFYHKILVETPGTIPSETTENIFRVRNVRLAERGFLPLHKAAAIYQSLDAKNIITRSPKILSQQTPAGFAAPFLPGHFADRAGIFAQSVATIDNAAISQQIQTEFAGLCNQMIVADRTRVQTREDLLEAVKKCCAYLNMGLKTIREKTGQKPGTSIRAHTLPEIFQVGFGLILDLKIKANKWRNTAWFEQNSLPLSFWGEVRLGLLGGLLLEKPLFFDNYKTGRLYREFTSLEDIEQSKHALDKIMALDAIFSKMNTTIRPCLGQNNLSCENLMLTPWARDYLGLPPDCSPLNVEQLADFFKNLFNPLSKKIPDPIKQNFLKWLTNKTSQSLELLTDTAGHALTEIFTDLESRYGAVAPADIDPRHIYMFLVEG